MTNRPQTAKPQIISNMAEGDITFEHDLGTWNFTRALADCAKGKHQPYRFDVAEMAAANASVEVDPAKVAHFAKMRSVLSADVGEEEGLHRSGPKHWAPTTKSHESGPSDTRRPKVPC